MKARRYMPPMPAASTVLLACLLTLTPSQSIDAAGLDAQAEELFNGLVNTTAPQAFKGQTMNTYTLGSMFVRTPVKNYQLATLTLPYIKTGGSCGNIDAFGGSFSHISSAQFKEALKGITSAIPGMLFQMAIDSVEPLLGVNMKWFKQKADEINRLNINSCEAAQKVLQTANGFMGFESVKFCESVATSLNLAPDAAAAREMCATPAGAKQANEQAKANPATAPQVPFRGNLVWSALRKMNHLDDDDREILMSISGTTIYPDSYENDKPSPDPRAPTGLNMQMLLRGNGDLNIYGKSWVPMLSCGSDTTQCLAPTTVNREMLPMTERVSRIMAGLANKIADGKGDTNKPSPTEIGFINNVPFPVYRMIAAGGTINNPAISETLRNSYNDYIAIEFVHALLTRAAREAMNVELADGYMNSVQRERLRSHMNRVRDFLTQLNADRAVAAQKAQTATTIMTQVAELERNLRASMPQQIRDLLAYSALGG